MKDALKTFLVVVLSLVLVAGAIAYVLGLQKLFAPVEQQIQYDTRQNSASYIDAMNTQIGAYILEYSMADDAATKAAIKAQICGIMSHMNPQTISVQGRIFAGKEGC